MRRRHLLRLGLGAAALLLTQGHTPYRQWVIYRKRRLLIGTSRADGPSYPLGLKVAEVLIAALPESKARASRAPDPWRLASLLSTAQFDVGILSVADAAALQDGRAPFAEFGGVPLRWLFSFGDHLLVSRPDFPDRHAFLISEALAEHGIEVPGIEPIDPDRGPIAVHPGTRAYAEAQPLPGEGPVTETVSGFVGHLE